MVRMVGRKCDSCDRSFTRKFAHMIHRLNCGRYQLRFQCVLCDAALVQHHGLIRHLENLHGKRKFQYFVLADVDTNIGKYLTVHTIKSKPLININGVLPFQFIDKKTGGRIILIRSFIVWAHSSWKRYSRP